ncbi:putative UDP-glucuronate:xylan alpha-glucuronosyltransferase 4 [Arachis stenosperma]|uniref:putative UDP-glucuronate:xylan alpha-glucuronosyltransferase 4 n=1 Tax=Arachis stenosperma TaxID=217475 RepID=UPI0025AC2C61|nr:putative UDP-glucuronate:xylan alpha-glucuronosyltransferase 4 [Arachis stenosperma]
MGSKYSSSSHFLLSSKQKTFVILLLFFIIIPLIIPFEKPNSVPNLTNRIKLVEKTNLKPPWFDIIENSIGRSNSINIGLVNINKSVETTLYQELTSLHPQVEKVVSVDFDHVDGSLAWKDLFPVWIDEDEINSKPKCHDMPMPTWEDYRDINVVVARVPCGNRTKKGGVRDVFRLHVNLVVANLAVESGWVKKLDSYEQVYVVFIGSCEPMIEIFRCDDLLLHDSLLGEFWVYEPDLRSLRQKTLMPVGSCQIAPPYAEIGKEVWRGYMSQSAATENYNQTMMKLPRFAYVTVLHSSEAYVCGAIALAQSLLQRESSTLQYNNYIIDLVLLADDSITPKSIRGLKAAGWKIKRIERILNPYAEKGTYNEWNYSKLRIWQLTMYDKIIFLDSDLLVLKNIDDFFSYPQLSAAPNDFTLFNSGMMVIEPSQCMFKHLLDKTLEIKSYNGGDQGLINEVITWWHRLPRKVNFLKNFEPLPGENEKHEIPNELYVMHYLGLKPWMCYRNYDCNWDMLKLHVFASDSAHQRWWEVYDNMPKVLQSYCGLSKKMDERNMKRRQRARNNRNFNDDHWNIQVKDPRRNRLADHYN